MRVLIVKISSMGDIIHTLPAVTDAVYAVSNISFDWVVEENFCEIPSWHVGIDTVIPISLRRWKKNWCNFLSWCEYYQCTKLLRTRNYDLIIDAQGLLKTSVFVMSILDNNNKYGMNYCSAREPISSFFLNRKYFIDKYQHAIERIRQLFACSLGYSKSYDLGKYNIDHLFPRKVNYNSPYLIFFQFTTHRKKCWPENYWDSIIQYVIEKGYYVKLPVWENDELLRVQRLLNRYNKIVILSKLTLRQIAVQISQAVAVVSVDTGFSHLAAALGCSGLTLYGPTNPDLIGTYGVNQKILCSSTQRMQDLTVLNVWENLLEILKNCN